MTEQEIPLGMRLKTQAGWNQVEEDWRRFLAMQPEGCLVAELEGAAVGTAVVTLFGQVAWISMVLVEQSVRGRGVGKALMRRALEIADSLGATSVRLDATPLGRPLYEKLGFVVQFSLVRYAGEARARPPSDSCAVRIATPDDYVAILALDQAVTKTAREKLLLRLFQEQPGEVRVNEHEGRIQGYMTCRSGSDAVQLGPCIASGEARPSLLSGALSRHAGRRLYWDIPSENQAAVQLARAAGLVPQRELLRMCWGNSVLEDLSRLWASSGPELG